MSGWELICLAIGLSMDAFAIAICQGLSAKRPTHKQILAVGFCFGFFQFLMPLLGAGASALFSAAVRRFGHWIAFLLMVAVGGNLLLEAKEEAVKSASSSFGALLLLSLAGSIDAFAAGVSFTCLAVKPLPASLLIGVITFFFSCVGVKIGSVFGTRYQAGARRFGGITLILLGFRFLAEQLH